jgi:hypothetical protein
MFHSRCLVRCVYCQQRCQVEAQVLILLVCVHQSCVHALVCLLYSCFAAVILGCWQ